MKTNTTILLTFFMLFSMASFGQTKEETLEWFKDFGEKLAKKEKICENETTFEFNVVLNDEYLICTELNTRRGFETSITLFYKLSNILVDDFTKLKIKTTVFCDIKYVQFNYKGEYTSKTTDFRGTNSTNYNKSSEITIYFKDVEDVKRVISAIMHMAKLSGAKENKRTF